MLNSKKAGKSQSLGLVAAVLIAVAGSSVISRAISTAWAQSVIEITIKDHKFSPNQITVNAGEGATLRVKNLDSTPEEFESKSLRIEKVIPGKSEAVIQLKPMMRGTYSFIGEFNESTAQGVIVVK
jgi:plastocyanin